MNPLRTTLRVGTLAAIAALLAPAVCGQDAAPALAPAATNPAPTLKAGDDVTPDALAAAAFFRGTAPAKWEQDKLYVFECWATWCGPCVAEIPHVNALHRKFKGKGLCVYGMNVMEDDKDKVGKFVKSKGDGMAYAVAFVGNDGPFANTWLKAAGVTGIPHAFVVKNGKLLFHTHPASLTDEVVSALLAGGDKETAVVAKFAAQPEISVPLPQREFPEEEIENLRATAAEMGKSGGKAEAQKNLDAFLTKYKNDLNNVAKAIISLETMKAYFGSANDAAGAAKYAEELAATYPDALPKLCSGGIDGLKKMMVEDINGGK